MRFLESWQLAAVGASLTSLAYLGIGLAVLVPLARSRRLRADPLGVVAAAALLACAGHHALHALGVLFGMGEPARPLESWDVLALVVGGAVLVLHRRHAPLTAGPAHLRDLDLGHRQGLELNDAVLQRLVVARMALDLDQPARAEAALASAIASTSRIVTDLLAGHHLAPDPGARLPHLEETLP